MSLPTLCGTSAVMGSDSLSLRFPVHKTDRDGVPSLCSWSQGSVPPQGSSSSVGASVTDPPTGGQVPAWEPSRARHLTGTLHAVTHGASRSPMEWPWQPHL